MFTLSHTTIHVAHALMETYGAAYKGSGTLTHKLSLYRHIAFHIPSAEDEQFLVSALASDSMCRNESIAAAQRQSEQRLTSPGALVFGAGTVQWAWALSDFRDGEQMGEDFTIQVGRMGVLVVCMWHGMVCSCFDHSLYADCVASHTEPAGRHGCPAPPHLF